MIFEYKEFSDPSDIYNNPHDRKCEFCYEKLNVVDLSNDTWLIKDSEIIDAHGTIREGYKEEGLEDCYLNLDMDTKSAETWMDFCDTCGWWRIFKNFTICAEVWQVWDIFFTCTGSLRNLEAININAPLNEVSQYLIAKYQDRFSINPRLFEEVVGSVFKGVGYNVHVTGYSNDGGIDVVLGSSSQKMIGVQVKRYKNKIKVEQIRAFAGALLLNGYNKGVFVTTSDYQPGAISAAESFKKKTLPIHLLNSQQFYDSLKISQKSKFDPSEILQMISDNQIKRLPYSGWVTPQASL
ncbi:restriction endonuclease [Flagellimonas sp. CMM7]|uniref:restriction endonuclease n=1 Tax=Flagellimonas sp. CMM7 TaxID=2654676 RepID=UPI0013D79323|nr:restriction endonuclease [Flagellimonas sp. CMM7]UII81512.1 restriction endonuclease [Flagellimonas sp. CMM7]